MPPKKREEQSTEMAPDAMSGNVILSEKVVQLGVKGNRRFVDKLVQAGAARGGKRPDGTVKIPREQLRLLLQGMKLDVKELFELDLIRSCDEEDEKEERATQKKKSAKASAAGPSSKAGKTVAGANKTISVKAGKTAAKARVRKKVAGKKVAGVKKTISRKARKTVAGVKKTIPSKAFKTVPAVKQTIEKPQLSESRRLNAQIKKNDVTATATNKKEARERVDAKFPKNLKMDLSSTEHQRAKEYIPPKCTIYKQGNRWLGSCPPSEEICERFSNPAEERNAARAMLKSLWTQYLKVNGMTKDECPIYDLLD